MPKSQKNIVLPAAVRVCQHTHYSDGHCAEMVCWNYYSRCPKHSFSGSDKARCSLEPRP